MRKLGLFSTRRGDIFRVLKLRLDLLEHLTADDIRLAAENSIHRLKPGPNFSRTGIGTLSSASSEKRAKEVKHSMELTRKPTLRPEKADVRL
jgi:hypothetical protein